MRSPGCWKSHVHARAKAADGGTAHALGLITKQAQLNRLRTDLTGRRYDKRHWPEAFDLSLVPAQGQEDDALDARGGGSFQRKAKDQPLGPLFTEGQGQLLRFDGLPPQGAAGRLVCRVLSGLAPFAELAAFRWLA